MKFYIKDCEISISFFFAAIITLMLLFDKENIVIFALLASFLHETGHLMMMILFKKPPKKIAFRIVGFHIENHMTCFNYTQDMMVAFAGVAVNFLVFFLFYFFTPYQLFAGINFCVGAFNLLPVYPLDGARGIYFYICRRYSEEYAHQFMRRMTVITLLPLAAAGFYLFIQTGYNMSLLVLVVYLLLCYNKA